MTKGKSLRKCANVNKAENIEKRGGLKKGDLIILNNYNKCHLIKICNEGI